MLRLDSTDFTALRQYSPSPSLLHHNACPVHCLFQGIQNGYRLIRNREYPIPPLCFQWASIILQKGHDILRRKGGHGTIQKSAVSGNILKNLLTGAMVGDIAAAFSGNQQFLPQSVVTLQQEHRCAVLCGSDGRKHSGRTASDNNPVIPHFRLTAFHRPRIHPRCAPDWQRCETVLPPAWRQWKQSAH